MTFHTLTKFELINSIENYLPKNNDLDNRIYLFRNVVLKKI